MGKRIQVLANPHNWPKQGYSELSSWAVIVVDMQNDYCMQGYYMDKAGFDIERLRKPIPKIVEVLRVAREAGVEIIFTRHGEAVVTPGQVTASQQGEEGWRLIDELVPRQNERIMDKSTVSAFMSSPLDSYLKSKKIKYLAFCGNTIDCCVHSTLRSANDLRYKCLLLEDCCGAVNEGLHKWSLDSITIENGVFGAVTTSENFIKSLSIMNTKS